MNKYAMPGSALVFFLVTGGLTLLLSVLWHILLTEWWRVIAHAPAPPFLVAVLLGCASVFTMNAMYVHHVIVSIDAFSWRVAIRDLLIKSGIALIILGGAILIWRG